MCDLECSELSWSRTCLSPHKEFGIGGHIFQRPELFPVPPHCFNISQSHLLLCLLQPFGSCTSSSDFLDPWRIALVLDVELGVNPRCLFQGCWAGSLEIP